MSSEGLYEKNADLECSHVSVYEQTEAYAAGYSPERYMFYYMREGFSGWVIGLHNCNDTDAEVAGASHYDDYPDDEAITWKEYHNNTGTWETNYSLEVLCYSGRLRQHPHSLSSFLP